MDRVEELRRAILEWGLLNGILVDAVDTNLSGDADLVPFPDEASEFFRTRKIVRIVADEAANDITIFSRLPIAKTKIKVMEESFAEAYGGEGISLKIRSSKPFKVDQSSQILGRFEPIRRIRNRICCGSSVGLGNQRNAGTLTALARKGGDSKTLYGISCNHVTGGCSTARPHTPIVVPGIQDVSSDHPEINLIGYHESAAGMRQGLPSVANIEENRDLAYFQVSDPKLLTSMQGNGDDAYDTPTTFAKPVRGMPVKKWGRSTGFKTGTISSINLRAEGVDYNVTSYYGPTSSQLFKGTIYFPMIIEVSGSSFSLGGDSGALVVTNDDKKERVVGIVIGGDKNKTAVLPIKDTLKDLGLTLVGGHNV